MNQKKIILITILVLMASISCKKKESNILRLKGSIDSKYPITLTIDKSSWEGEYYYDKNKKIIELKGSMDKNKLRLVERADGKITGEFDGTLEKDDSYKGIWLSADGKRKLPFELTKESDNSDKKTSSKKITVEADDMVGKFARDKDTDIELTLKGPTQFYLDGSTVSGNGNMGEFAYLVVSFYQDEMKIIYDDTSEGYKVTIKIIDKDNLTIEEEGNLPHGNGAGFNGKYKRVN